MADERNQPPAQSHPEGGYGDRARDANRERIEGRDDGDADAPDTGANAHHPREGGHKIYEDRQQHDEADKNAEKNRLRRDRGW